MKILFLFIVVCFSFHFHAKGQGNFKKGFVITIEGDTLKGYISHRAWEANPEQISFRVSLEKGEKKVFDIHNCVFFQIDSIVSFKRDFVSVSMDEVRYSMLHVGPDTTKIKKTVFLKILVDGCNSNLYSYTDSIKTRYYYLVKNEPQAVELSYRTYYYKSRNNSIVTLYDYRGQLQSLAQIFGTSSRELSRKIENSRYLTDELSEIFMMINGYNALSFCRNVAKNERTGLYFYTGIGMERSILSTIEIRGYPLANSENSQYASWMPFPFVGFDVRKTTGSRLFIREESGFSYYKLSISDFNDGEYNYNLSQWNMNLSSNLNYNVIFSSKIKAYLGAGFDFHISMGIKTSFSDDHNLQRNCKSAPSKLFWVSIPLNAGILLNDHYSLFFHYHIPMTTLDRYGGARTIKIMEIGIAYHFNH